MAPTKRASTPGPPKKRSVDEPRRKKVAIVGSGCAGIGALWALKDTDYEVHLFEKNSKLGGHTNTQTWKGEKASTKVDTGFIVMNTATYPNFIRFLEEVGVKTSKTEMTFSVSRDGGKFEWSGEKQGIFSQRRNLFRPRHWRMIFDIVRFNQFALDLLGQDEERSKDLTIGEYLDQYGYSQAFRDDYLIPMTAAVWSTSPDKASLEFPAMTLVRFMWNHHLLSTLAERPDWLTIWLCAQQYIDAVTSQFPEDRLKIFLDCEVQGLKRPEPGRDEKVTLAARERSGEMVSDRYDHVVLACHGDEILPILTGFPLEDNGVLGTQRKKSGGKFYPKEVITATGEIDFKGADYEKMDDLGYAHGISKEEYDVFKHFKTTENVCYLHSDLSLMPRRRDTWTSWNYLVTSQPSKQAHPAGVSLTYNMNILQHIDEEVYGPVLVTMNPPHAPADSRTQGKFFYRHPLYTTNAVSAQERLQHIQGTRGVSYCGAWTKYGFHEDGFSSGLKVAMEHLDAEIPFEFKDSTYSRGEKPELCRMDHLLRLVLSVVLILLRIVEAVLGLPVVAGMVGVMEGLGSRVLDFGESAGVLK